MFTSVTLLALLGSAAAHMEIQFPPPLKSKFNPNTPSGAADYDMIAPLQASGADFPCKGYQSLLGSAAGAPTASFAIGAPANMTITGGANHGGGSCQIALSTDNAQTFTVIQSIIGGCPASGTSNLDFTIPADAPAGDHVLAWTWHNQIGNREMYMNCAAVTLTEGGGAKRMEKVNRAAAYSSRPGIFIANVGPAGDGCTTEESFDVDYPEPGPDVINDSAKAKTPSCGATQQAGTGGGDAAAPPASGSDSGAGAENSSSASPVAPAPNDAPAPAPAPPAPAPAPPAPASPAPATTLTTSARPAATPAAGAGADSSPSAASAAAPIPTDNGLGSSTNAGSGSAPAASAANAPGSTCAEEGAWACLAGGASFQRCASGQWSVVQALAPGTECSGGVSDTMNMVAVAQ